MTKRSKADFRALRESLGLTQTDLAIELGVQPQTVKKWEAMNHPYSPPESAWIRLDEMEAEQILATEDIVNRIIELVNRFNGDPGLIPIKYYRDQDDYNVHGRDVAPYGLINARIRAAAKELRRRKLNVQLLYPEEYEKLLAEAKGI